MSGRERTAAKAGAVLLFLGLAGWVLGQGFEVRTSDTATEVQRFRIEPGSGVGAPASAYYLNANLGIGTATPAAKLHITSGAGAEVLVDNASEWQAKSSAGTPQGFLRPRWSDDITYLNFGTGGLNVRNNASTSVMFIEDDGDVGIGTTSPQAKLHVTDDLIAGSSTGTPNKLNLNYPSGHVTIRSPGYLFLTGQWASYLTGNLYYDGTNWNRYNTANGGSIWGALTGGSVAAWQAPSGANPAPLTSPLSIINTGHVGLGVAIPQAKLDISANSTTWGGWNEAIRLKPDAHAAITHPGGGLLFGLHGNRNFYWADTTNSWYSMYLEPSGELTVRDKVLINGTDNGWGNTVINGRVWSASNNIHLSPPNGSWVYINDDYREAGGAGGGTAGLQVDGSVRFSTAGGNVGIYESSPQGGLHVGSGDALCDGSMYAGYDDTSTNGSQFYGYRAIDSSSPRTRWAYFDCTSTSTNSFRMVASNGTPADITNSYFTAGGDHRVNDTYQSNAFDLAELYLTREKALESGDVAVADPGNRLHLRRSTRPYDPTAVGIISTDPSILMGNALLKGESDRFETYVDAKGRVQDIGWKPLNRKVEARPLALAGRVPCRVTDEEGPIRPGDLLTSSSTPGAAMKCVLHDLDAAKDFAELKRMTAENERRRDAVIGKALEAWEGKGEGLIEVLTGLK